LLFLSTFFEAEVFFREAVPDFAFALSVAWFYNRLLVFSEPLAMEVLLSPMAG
jgi:hypothetical protein